MMKTNRIRYNVYTLGCSWATLAGVGLREELGSKLIDDMDRGYFVVTTIGTDSLDTYLGWMWIRG